MKKSYEFYINEFVEGIIEQEKGIYECRERAYIRKQEKRIDKAVEKLRESEEGIEVFTHLLIHANPRVSLTTAVYLLNTSTSKKAVETIKEYAKGPEDSFITFCAKLRLEDFEKQKADKEEK